MKVVILGSASAVASEDLRKSHLVVCGEGESRLLDCGTSPASRLRAYGLNPEHLIGVAWTHFHPDHASGAAAFIMDE